MYIYDKGLSQISDIFIHYFHMFMTKVQFNYYENNFDHYSYKVQF